MRNLKHSNLKIKSWMTL